MLPSTMNRNHTRVLVALAAAVVFVGLVTLVLRFAHVAEPAATTVRGPTAQRLWATAAAALALAGALAGGLGLARPAGRFGTNRGKLGAVLAGLVAAVNGGLALASAQGGPGSGNGVVGAAVALVLGVIAAAFGGLALARSRNAG